MSVAAVGYVFREVEEDVLGVASPPDLTQALLELKDAHVEWEDWFAAVAGAASTCALGEEMAQDPTLQWEIPGVGGEARSMFINEHC